MNTLKNSWYKGRSGYKRSGNEKTFMGFHQGGPDKCLEENQKNKETKVLLELYFDVV